MTPLVVDPCGYLKPHHSVGHCQRRSVGVQARPPLLLASGVVPHVPLQLDHLLQDFLERGNVNGAAGGRLRWRRSGVCAMGCSLWWSFHILVVVIHTSVGCMKISPPSNSESLQISSSSQCPSPDRSRSLGVEGVRVRGKAPPMWDDACVTARI